MLGAKGGTTVGISAVSKIQSRQSYLDNNFESIHGPIYSFNF